VRRSRIYLAPSEEQEAIARTATPAWFPEGNLADDPRNIWTVNYGLTRFRDLFTQRQLVALTTFSDLVGEARGRILADAITAGLSDDGIRLNDGGLGAAAYADAVVTYLGLSVSRLADILSALSAWSPTRDQQKTTFARQALPMVWDFAEANAFSGSAGDFNVTVASVARALDAVPALGLGHVKQLDATQAANGIEMPIVATDPPYYDNISYADLADYFYVWLRPSLGAVYPDLFNTLLTPKAAELIATPYRFGGSRREAEKHFETGLGLAFERIRDASNPDYPVTVFYAFKQAESEDHSDGRVNVASTGWETMLEGLLSSGLSIGGTWPMRTERTARSISIGTNALASSIILVCRPRRIDSGVTTRSDFVASLRRELPSALRTLQHGNIAPVDLAQASIGPGMAIFSRYAKVLEADGSRVKVRAALALINQVLDEVVSEQEGEFDADTRFAITWFSQYRFDDGRAGEADVLARARNTSVAGLGIAGIARVVGDKVRLLARDELDAAWNPATDRRPTVWEATQHLVRRYFDEGSEERAAELLSRLGGVGEAARDLAYRLYLLCDRKGWTEDARAYNGLVVAWPEISRLALGIPQGPTQQSLDFGG
jgi:putative DNA methylase